MFHGRGDLLVRCSECLMPDTRPGSRFVDGVCGACRNFGKRTEIDWSDRSRELDEVLDGFRGSEPYDCIVPVSGGKDSHRLVKEVVDRGMKPLLVTVNDSFTHTTAGVGNLRNLITKFNLNHWQYTISHDLFVRATRWAFEETGEALKYVEYAIYTIPYMLAQQMGIGLVVFGENAAYEYGATENNTYVADLNETVRKIESEYEFWSEGGVSPREVDTIKPNVSGFPLVIYMSYFLPWSSVDNYELAKELGFKDLAGEWDRLGTIENFEQIDSYAYMVHLWLKFPKFGFQRVCDIASRRVREGRLSLEEAKDLIEKNDHVIDPTALADFCRVCGYTEDEFWEVVNNASWNKAGVYG